METPHLESYSSQRFYTAHGSSRLEPCERPGRASACSFERETPANEVETARALWVALAALQVVYGRACGLLSGFQRGRRRGRRHRDGRASAPPRSFGELAG
jgi:hypothetical protein